MVATELSERKKAILSAVISSYIANGEPIGSKLLCSMLNTNLSSATLRNELSDLCSLGLLTQPHTSAGRIPTCSGYRMYVNNIMKPTAVSPEVRLAIDSTLESISHTPEQMPVLACQILADLTGLPSFCATMANDSAKVKRVRLIPIGKKTMLMVIVSTDGITKSRIVLSDYEVGEALLSVFSNICKICIVGHKLNELNTPYLQTIIARVGDYGLAVMPLLSEAFQIIAEMFEPQLHFRGESKLLSKYKQESDALLIGELLSQKQAVIDLAASMKAPVGVIFGDDYGHRIEAGQSCMVLAKYRTGGGDLGRIGVLGPIRMPYEQLIPSIEYFASRLGFLMTRALRDMED